ncbi:class B sortase [Clostridium baratii]
MSSRKLKILICFLLCLAGIFFYLYISGGLHAINSKYKNDSIKDNVVYETDDPLNRKIDFEKLKGINNDIVGWLYVPGTKIDYPILIGDKDNTYLNKDIEKKYNQLGSIFSYAKTKRDLSDSNIFLFGHNMRQYQMFGELKKYINEDFMKKHNKFYVYTERKTMELDIVSIFMCNENDNIFSTGFELGTVNYLDYISSILARNKFSDYYLRKDKNLNLVNNQLISLVTCYGEQGTTERLVVSGSVIKEKYIID